MILFAFGGKCGSPVTIVSSSLLPNRSGINKEPNAALPIPKLNLDKKRRRFILRPCSKISFSISFYFFVNRESSNVNRERSVVSKLLMFGNVIHDSRLTSHDRHYFTIASSIL